MESQQTWAVKKEKPKNGPTSGPEKGQLRQLSVTR